MNSLFQLVQRALTLTSNFLLEHLIPFFENKKPYTYSHNVLLFSLKNNVCPREAII